MNDETFMTPVHPGVILREEFLDPMGISEYRLAKSIRVPQTRISQITKGRWRISADVGQRLSRYFDMSEGFWPGLQENYDRDIAKNQLVSELADIVGVPRGVLARTTAR